MKKYNKFNYNMLLAGIVLPLLLFFISMNLTYAYFTASTTPQNAKQKTGVVEIILTEANGKLNSNEITNSTKLIPGESIEFSGTITNSGTVNSYAILQIIINVQKSDSTDIINLSKKHYTFVNNQAIQITGTQDNYSATAFLIESTSPNNTQSFNIDYHFSFDRFDNSYEDAKITYQIKAYAIQVDNVETEMQATNLLIDLTKEL